MKSVNKQPSNIEESHDTLAESTTEDAEMQEEESSPSAISYARMMLSGQYTYITYLLLSATSFFFWLTPNSHLLRRFTKW